MELALSSQMQAIEDAWDADLNEVPIGEVCRLLGIERTHQNELQFRGAEKVHRGVAAVECAVKMYNAKLFQMINNLAQYDNELQKNVHFGGRSTELRCEDETTKQTINRLFTFATSAMWLLIAHRTGLSMAANSDIWDNLPEEAVSDRWLSAMNECAFLAHESRMKPQILIFSVATWRLRVGFRGEPFLVHQNYLYRRKFIKYKIPVMLAGELICATCGKLEHEHDLRGAVSARKGHVFTPMEIPAANIDTGEPIWIKTGCYERHQTVMDFLYELTDPNKQFSLFINGMHNANVLPFVADRLCSMANTIPQLKTRRGLFSMDDGIFDVGETKFYPYICECMKFTRPGMPEPTGKNFNWGHGIELAHLPKKITRSISQFESKEDWVLNFDVPEEEARGTTCAGSKSVVFDVAEGEELNIVRGMVMKGDGICEGSVVRSVQRSEGRVTVKMSRNAKREGAREITFTCASQKLSDGVDFVESEGSRSMHDTCKHCNAVTPMGKDETGVKRAWVAQKHFSGVKMNWPSKMSRMLGPLKQDIDDHICQLCQCPRNHPDHMPCDVDDPECEECEEDNPCEDHTSHAFRDHPQHFNVCFHGQCGAPAESHAPVCRGVFMETAYERAKPAENCWRCRKQVTSNLVACECPAGPFNYMLREQTLGTDETHVPAAWHHLEHPAWDGMFTSQFEDPVTRRVVQWMITLVMSRSVLPAKERDSMDLLVSLLGPGGNGKSTILHLLQSMFERSDVGTIPNNAQRQVSLLPTPVLFCCGMATTNLVLFFFFYPPVSIRAGPRRVHEYD